MGAGPAAARGLPHSVQNRLFGAIAAPQCGQFTLVLSLSWNNSLFAKFYLYRKFPAGLRRFQ
jgi:hypothetical protein